MKTQLTFVLDATGSMDIVRDETIQGFNDFIADRKKEKNTRMTLVTFNSKEIRTVYESKKIKTVPNLTRENYTPKMWTPLYDAVGKAIKDTEKAIDGKDHRVLFVVMTDGLENASRTYTLSNIQELIKSKTDKDEWTFVYLGANQDAWEVGGQMNVPQGNIQPYAASDPAGAMGVTSSSVARYAASQQKSTETFFADVDSDDDQD